MTDHGRRATPGVPRRRVVTLLVALLVPLFVATVAGVVALWPRADPSTYLPEAGRFAAAGVTTVSAVVEDVEPHICDEGVEGVERPTRKAVCATVTAVLDGGTGAGGRVTVDVRASVVDAGIYPGDAVELLRLPAADEAPVTYTFAEFERGAPLVWLAAAFTVLVVLVARLRGLLGLLGLVLAFALILEFLLPALLAGENPLLVGVVGSAAIMFIVLYVAHGISIRTTTALIGTLFGLASAAVLGQWAARAAHLTGAASEDDLAVGALGREIDLSGLLLCGLVIATLGVLNDVTVTQASAVWELHALQPSASPAQLFAGAMRIGRDHISSTVYTIAFAYAGASLPVLILINLYQRPVADPLTGELLAEEVVSTLVGAIGLVLSVPLTTAVGVALVTAARAGSTPAGAPSAEPAGAPPTATGR